MMKKHDTIQKLRVALSFCLFLGLLFGAWWLVSDVGDSGSGEVTVVSIRTENDADSTLICSGGTGILIDAGEACDAPHILEILQSNGVQQLEYLILTHGDADHIGGAEEVLRTVPAKRVIQPYYDSGEGVRMLNAFLEEAGIPVTYPTRTLRMHAAGFQFLVYPPLEKHYNDDNNYSLAVLIQHGSVNMLFAGDALRKRSEEMLMVDWPQMDLYKVPHHGRANSATEVLFDTLLPEIAVITAEAADEAVLKAAQRCNTQIYYTAEQDWSFLSDGNQLKLYQDTAVKGG